MDPVSKLRRNLRKRREVAVRRPLAFHARSDAPRLRRVRDVPSRDHVYYALGEDVLNRRVDRVGRERHCVPTSDQLQVERCPFGCLEAELERVSVPCSVDTVNHYRVAADTQLFRPEQESVLAERLHLLRRAVNFELVDRYRRLVGVVKQHERTCLGDSVAITRRRRRIAQHRVETELDRRGSPVVGVVRQRVIGNGSRRWTAVRAPIPGVSDHR